jgi:ABC-2 type transport system ATP-binding protein
MIEVEGLRKEYGELVAVDDISLRAEAGRIFGLLGPNGAGKSTTIGCISGLIRPTAGSLRVRGHDVVRDATAARRRLGVVPQELALYEDLSALENLRFWGAAYGLSGPDLERRVAEVLQRIGLVDRAKEHPKKFSGGMKRRLNFGCGIVHRPEVLLLDEPTVGVDPQSRVKLLDLVREEAKHGACVLYTTHYMEEAESLCDELAIIDHGRIVAAGTLAELRSRGGERDVLRLSGSFSEGAARAAMTGVEGVEIVHVEETALRLAVVGATKRLPELFRALEDAGCEVRETTMTQPNLESLFIQLTGKELRE